MKRALSRCLAVLALSLALLAVPFGPGAPQDARAATSNGKIYDEDGGLLALTGFNSGLHHYHENDNSSPDNVNFFQVMDVCDDGVGPALSWTIEGRNVDGWKADDCTGGILGFKFYMVKTGYEERDMAAMQWFLMTRDADGIPLDSTQVMTDWAGSYSHDEGSDYFPYSSVYQDEYFEGGTTRVVTIKPTSLAYFVWAGPAETLAENSPTTKIWNEIEERTPLPDDLTSDQRESLYKQLWCHLKYALPGEKFGGHTWDLEADRPNIPWGDVEGPIDVNAHTCNWGSETDGYDYQRPTDRDPENMAPVVDAGPDVTGDEGSAVTLKGTAADDNGTPATTWTYTPVDNVDEGATCSFADEAAPRTTVTCTDDGTYKVTLTADDGVNSPVSDSAVLTVHNVAPALTLKQPEGWDVHRVETEVGLAASFTDPGSNDTHTCEVTWDDGSTSEFAATDRTCDTTHAYDHAGMDTLSIQVTDDDGGSDSDERMIVVYDPRAGLAAGAGTLNDGLGFSVLAKYPSADSTVPAGAVSLSVPTDSGRRTIVSTELEWLVITPSGEAAVKGSSAAHGFLGYLESGRFRGVLWPLSQGDIPPTAPASLSYDSTPGEDWDLDRAQAKQVSTGLTVIDTGWIPGLPVLPPLLGTTVGSLTDSLPDLRLDLGTTSKL
ncbi:hypothetical protein AB0I77_04890 [Streptomyces sp. NPDC050619]|uniref:hypothetical protein n=1 Tax=Streptomyces sp. NPDC050619 TaxID=3157214 RepID=UPI00342DB996